MEFTQGVRFDTLGLSPEMMRAIAQREIEESTPVQAGCIPPMLAWKDIVAKAQELCQKVLNGEILTDADVEPVE